MKVALLSDIHGNVPALDAVLDDVAGFAPDVVVVNGDVVSRGPRSKDALQRLAEADPEGRILYTRGNHEDYVVEHRTPRPRDVRFEIHRLSFWTYTQIGPDWVERIAAWPFSAEGPEGLRVAHASMRGNQDGIFPFMDDDDVRARIAPPPVVFGCGHVHWPFVREVDDTLVVNSGAVGSPADGDVRASYARLEHRADGWHAEVVRVPYDRAAAAQAFEDTGFLADSGAVSRVIHAEWSRAEPMVGRWFGKYARAVQAGEIGLEAAVDTFLGD